MLLLLPIVLALRVAAAPAEPWRPTTESFPVDEFTASRLFRAHSFAAAAYCAENSVDNAVFAPILCKTPACQDLQEQHVQSLYQFHGRGDADATGYIALDHLEKQIVVAFRGSASLRNAFADSQFWMTAAPDVCLECKAVHGFYNFWLGARPVVMETVAWARQRHENYTVAVVGHSLGGAVATIAAPVLRNAGYNVDLFSFSAPRSGNAEFARYVSSNLTKIERNYRVVHGDDWVPKVPMTGLAYHIADEYYITAPNKMPVYLEDIRHFKGYQFKDYVGGNGMTKSTDVSFRTHSWIFDNITQCSPLPRYAIEMWRGFESLAMHWNTTAWWAFRPGW